MTAPMVVPAANFRVPMPLMYELLMEFSEALLRMPITTLAVLLKVTFLPPKLMLPEVEVADSPGWTVPLMVMLLLVSANLLSLTPVSAAFSETVSEPVPSEPPVPKRMLPAEMFTAPVLFQAPVTVISPEPILVKLSLLVTMPSNLKLLSLPTCHVLALTVAFCWNEQKPPNSPLPVSLPMRNVLPEFCTMTFSGMLKVQFSEPLLVSSVKRLSAAMAACGTMVPLKAERLSWSEVRVATQPFPCSPAQVMSREPSPVTLLV